MEQPRLSQGVLCFVGVLKGYSPSIIGGLVEHTLYGPGLLKCLKSAVLCEDGLCGGSVSIQQGFCIPNMLLLIFAWQWETGNGIDLKVSAPGHPLI